MKKVFLAFGLVVCITGPAFATEPTGIPADANGAAYNDPENNCIVDVLGVSSGSVSLQADWDPNEITVVWNPNGGTASDGTAYSSNGGTVTCNYDGDVTLPPAPTMVGHTFAGWEVDNA